MSPVLPPRDDWVIFPCLSVGADVYLTESWREAESEKCPYIY